MIAFLARHDALTRLPNRVLFTRAHWRWPWHRPGPGSGIAVLCLDLDALQGC